MQNFKKKNKKNENKKCMPTKLLLVQIGVKWFIYPNQQQQGPLLEISYTPLLSVMTIHYDGVYQISSLSANLSLEDLKQFLRQTQPKTNN